MPEELPPDPDAQEAWEKLPKNEPSKSALPPMTGGTQLALWILGAAVILVVLGLLARGL